MTWDGVECDVMGWDGKGMTDLLYSSFLLIGLPLGL